MRLDFVTEEFEQTLVGQFILAARAFVAATEREKIVERTVRGKLERARSGRLPQGTGKGCYGYMYVPGTGHRLLDPEQAPIFVRIFEEFVAGKSCNRIANDLNADDIPTLTGRHRHPITVRRAIDNGTYTGRTIYRKTRVEMIRRPGERQRSRRVVERDESEHIEIPGASPPIVSRGSSTRLRRFAGSEHGRHRHATTRSAAGSAAFTAVPAWWAAPRTTGGTRTTAATASTSRRRTSAASPARFAPTRSSPPCAKSSRSCWPTPRWWSRWPRRSDSTRATVGAWTKSSASSGSCGTASAGSSTSTRTVRWRRRCWTRRARN